MISNFKVEECAKCGAQTYLTNRTHKLCENCNCHRIHGVSLIEWNRKKQSAAIAKKREKIATQPRKSIVQFSKKGQEIKDRLTEVKKQIRQEAHDNNRYYCWGCGKAGEKLDCSHTLSVAQRPDLQFDKQNINLFCRNCHEDWESGEIGLMLELHTFSDDMAYILEKDETRFQKIMNKLDAHIAHN